jgi:hypothetical protein
MIGVNLGIPLERACLPEVRMNEHQIEPNRWPATMMDDSPTLFPIERAEFIKQSDVAAERLHDWNGMGLLSFDVHDSDRLEEWHQAEVAIVRSVLEAGLKPSTVAALFESLPKPYRYDPRRLCYNVALRTWHMIPSQSYEEIQDAVREDLISDMSETADAYIEELADEGDVDTLEALLTAVAAALKRAKSVDVGD